MDLKAPSSSLSDFSSSSRMGGEAEKFKTVIASATPFSKASTSSYSLASKGASGASTVGGTPPVINLLGGFTYYLEVGEATIPLGTCNGPTRDGLGGQDVRQVSLNEGGKLVTALDAQIAKVDKQIKVLTSSSSASALAPVIKDLQFRKTELLEARQNIQSTRQKYSSDPEIQFKRDPAAQATRMAYAKALTTGGEMYKDASRTMVDAQGSLETNQEFLAARREDARKDIVEAASNQNLVSSISQSSDTGEAVKKLLSLQKNPSNPIDPRWNLSGNSYPVLAKTTLTLSDKQAAALDQTIGRLDHAVKVETAKGGSADKTGSQAWEYKQLGDQLRALKAQNREAVGSLNKDLKDYTDHPATDPRITPQLSISIKCLAENVNITNQLVNDAQTQLGHPVSGPEGEAKNIAESQTRIISFSPLLTKLGGSAIMGPSVVASMVQTQAGVLNNRNEQLNRAGKALEARISLEEKSSSSSPLRVSELKIALADVKYAQKTIQSSLQQQSSPAETLQNSLQQTRSLVDSASTGGVLTATANVLNQANALASGYSGIDAASRQNALPPPQGAGISRLTLFYHHVRALGKVNAAEQRLLVAATSQPQLVLASYSAEEQRKTAASNPSKLGNEARQVIASNIATLQDPSRPVDSNGAMSSTQAVSDLQSKAFNAEVRYNLVSYNPNGSAEPLASVLPACPESVTGDWGKYVSSGLQGVPRKTIDADRSALTAYVKTMEKHVARLEATYMHLEGKPDFQTATTQLGRQITYMKSRLQEAQSDLSNVDKNLQKNDLFAASGDMHGLSIDLHILGSRIKDIETSFNFDN